MAGAEGVGAGARGPALAEPRGAGGREGASERGRPGPSASPPGCEKRFVLFNGFCYVHTAVSPVVCASAAENNGAVGAVKLCAGY